MMLVDDVSYMTWPKSLKRLYLTQHEYSQDICVVDNVSGVLILVVSS